MSSVDSPATRTLPSFPHLIEIPSLQKDPGSENDKLSASGPIKHIPVSIRSRTNTFVLKTPKICFPSDEPITSSVVQQAKNISPSSSSAGFSPRYFVNSVISSALKRYMRSTPSCPELPKLIEPNDIQSLSFIASEGFSGSSPDFQLSLKADSCGSDVLHSSDPKPFSLSLFVDSIISKSIASFSRASLRGSKSESILGHSFIPLPSSFLCQMPGTNSTPQMLSTIPEEPPAFSAREYVNSIVDEALKKKGGSCASSFVSSVISSSLKAYKESAVSGAAIFHSKSEGFSFEYEK